MKVTLASKDIEVSENNLDEFTHTLIHDVLIPHYKENNDWIAAIEYSLTEAKRVFKEASIDKYSSGVVILQAIEQATGKEIAELTGNVNTVEILFSDVQDFVAQINNILNSGWSEEKIRLEISNEIEHLTRFEIVELLLAIARKTN